MRSVANLVRAIQQNTYELRKLRAAFSHDDPNVPGWGWYYETNHFLHKQRRKLLYKFFLRAWRLYEVSQSSLPDWMADSNAWTTIRETPEVWRHEYVVRITRDPNCWVCGMKRTYPTRQIVRRVLW